MTDVDVTNQQTTTPTPAKRAWATPVLEELPRLTELTLSSSIPGAGFVSDGAGSTVF